MSSLIRSSQSVAALQTREAKGAKSSIDAARLGWELRSPKCDEQRHWLRSD